MSKVTVYGVLRLDVPKDFNMQAASLEIDIVRRKLDDGHAVQSDPIQWFDSDPRDRQRPTELLPKSVMIVEPDPYTDHKNVAELVAAGAVAETALVEIDQTLTHSEIEACVACVAIEVVRAALKPFEPETDTEEA